MNQNYDVLSMSKQNQDASKYPLGVSIQENVTEDSDNESHQEDDEEVNDDVYDEKVNDDVYDYDNVCNSMMKDVRSSTNSPDKKKTPVEGEVVKEPGGMFPQEVA